MLQAEEKEKVNNTVSGKGLLQESEGLSAKKERCVKLGFQIFSSAESKEGINENGSPKINQDRWVVVESEDGTHLGVIADGAKKNGEFVAEELRKRIQVAKNFSASELSKRILVTESIVHHKTPEPSASTVVAFSINAKGKLNVSQAGDSPLYVIRDGVVIMKTNDHDKLHDEQRKFMKQFPNITSPQALAKAKDLRLKSNIVTNVVRTHPKDSVKPEEYTGKVKPGDVIVACSDGGTKYFTDAEFLATVKESLKHSYPAEYLTNLARKNAEKRAEKLGRNYIDDITFIFFRVVPL